MEKSALGLGLVSSEMLKAIGIEDLGALKKVGSIAAFVAVKEANYKPTLNLLWALEGAITGCHWQQIARNSRVVKNSRNELLWQLKIYEGQRLLDRYLVKQNKNEKPYIVLISIGSNENAKQNISGLLKIIELFGSVEISPIYESASHQDFSLSYLNLVIKISTFLSVTDVISIFKKIEILFGRKKNHRNKKVTLDIDVLTFDRFLGSIDGIHLVEKVPLIGEVQLPREKDLAQPYVLGPLAKLCPEMKHPIYLKNYRDLWGEYMNLHGNPLTEVSLENTFAQQRNS